MGFQNKANALHPQIIIFVVDDSGSMQGQKSKTATEAAQDSVITLQSHNLQSHRFRFLLSIAKFGDGVTPLEIAKKPGDVNLQNLVFDGSSGQTNIAASLQWAKQAVEESLQVCRALPDYDEAQSPNPLVVLITDGENTGGDVGAPAQALRSVSFTGGQVDVVVCGVGLEPKDLATAQKIASDPALAANIRSDEIAKFFAAVTITVIKEGNAAGVIDQLAQMR
jgi:uncharacterized protein YegL